MKTHIRPWLLCFTTAVGIGMLVTASSAADFTVSIFDLKGRQRNGQNVNVRVTAENDKGGNVTDPKVTFDGDSVVTTDKNVTTGSTKISIKDDRVSAVTFTFTDPKLEKTVVQRLRNNTNLVFEVAVPEEKLPSPVIICPPSNIDCPFLCVDRHYTKPHGLLRFWRR